MNLKEAKQRIEELERRIKELEARQVMMIHYHYSAPPSATILQQPYYPATSPWVPYYPNSTGGN